VGLLDIFGNQVTETIPTNELLMSLVTAFITGILISFIYKKTYTGVAYTKSSILTIILLAMVTSLVIRTVNSNLPLSLGMVGSLSIVRFRTAVKDSVDTIFIFWAITTGIMAGAGLYLVTFIASLLLGILYVLSYVIVFKQLNKYLLVINVDADNAEKIIEVVKKRKKCMLKTQSIKKDNVELTFEISGKDSSTYMLDLKKNKGVESVHLVNID